MNRAFLVFIAATFPLSSFGACGMVPYEFVGTVVDSETAQPLTGVAIWPFLDDLSHTANKGYATTYPDFDHSGKDGKFVVNSYFYSFVSYSNIAGHDCSARPTRITMILSVGGYLSKRVTFEIPEREQSGEGPIHIEIPAPIELHRPSKAAVDLSANKSLKFVPALRASTGRSYAAPLN